MEPRMDAGLADLIAHVLTPSLGRLGAARANVIAAELLARDGLLGLARAAPASITARLTDHGLPSRASEQAGVALAAAFDLGRRVIAEQARPRRRLASSADVASWAAGSLAQLPHEELWVLALDGRSRLRSAQCVARGGLHGLGARPADPLRAALRADASAMVLVHNHPSGDPTPSAEDVAFTRAVAIASQAIGLPLVDHVIVSREGFTSVSAEVGADG